MFLSAHFSPGLAASSSVLLPLEAGQPQTWGNQKCRAQPAGNEHFLIFSAPVQSPLKEIIEQQSDTLQNGFVSCTPVAKPLGPGWRGGWK